MAKQSNNYFSETRKSRRSTIFIVGVILLLLSIPIAYSFLSNDNKKNDSFKNELDQLSVIQPENEIVTDKIDKGNSNHQRENYNSTYEINSNSLFYFDPNTASFDDLKKLGLSNYAINNIQKYTSKGGKFKSPEDIRKVYGISPQQANLLIPYVKLKGNGTESYSQNYSPNQNYNYPQKTETKSTYTPKKIQSLDINNSDTTQWIALPGIGSKLAQRITNFRDKLGGFSSVDQVAETYGLSDSTFQKIKPYLISSSNIKQININTASEDVLKMHPYIKSKNAKIIVAYRNQHGNYGSVNDLNKLIGIDPNELIKMKPYLKTND